MNVYNLKICHVLIVPLFWTLNNIDSWKDLIEETADKIVKEIIKISWFMFLRNHKENFFI